LQSINAVNKYGRETRPMGYWDDMKKDFQRSLKESMSLLKEKAATMKEKAEELTEEGKKRYKIFNIQMKMQNEIAELGGRIYDLSSKSGNPLLDKKVKTRVARIRKLETQVAKLKGKKTTKLHKSIGRGVKK
jgi:hypothetical protein